MKKIQELIDNGTITFEDIEEYINNPDSHYKLIDLYEDDDEDERWEQNEAKTVQ